MTILLTGASGFLGSRILKELEPDNSVTTLGRQLSGSRHIVCDLAKEAPDLIGHSFDVVVNAAGKAHSVPRNSQELADYERVNVQGTARLLASLEKLPVLPQSIVHISTVLVYGRSEGKHLNEQTSLDAKDAYGYSKVKAEAVVQAWGVKNGVRVTILRLPLVVAEQPTGNLAAMLKGIRRGYYVRIGAGLTRRSMVRADDVAAVIIRAASVSGIYNLTDGRHPSVRELEDAIARTVGRNRIPSIPLSFSKAIAYVGDGINALIGRRFPLDSAALQKLTGSLTFSDEAARQHLNWNPRSVLDSFK
ncbi:NAD-dependent epimerase/dehydratase family protein [Spirosoma endbachense]|uniref:NAD-dependent epimerase/dehydratase family protein n=1 Tax=Spirosoma endbachense TaxID=2666025 RepID=A0A6P1W549_9BACT|nr:NAD-dependent epimerase/dehydratase family protein [Spirosoma endbachense]QHV99698.1 NAD-dependent epimerase/dehydratase family protein [Spirosoma endbachense]